MLTLLGISQGQFRRHFFKICHRTKKIWVKLLRNTTINRGIAVRAGLKVQRLDRILDPVVITKFCKEHRREALFDLGCAASLNTKLSIALFQLR